MSSSRAVTALLVLCLAAIVGYGCGGGAAGETDGSGVSKEATAKVRAANYARAVNLRASDLPYFEAVAEEDQEDPEEEIRRDRELRKCVGAGDPDEVLAEVKSPEFGTEASGEALRVGSSVEVAADPRGAARELRLIRTRRAERCLRSVFVAAAEEEESSSAEVRHASVFQIPTPAPEIERGFAYRFVASIAVHPNSSELTAYGSATEAGPSQEVKVYADVLGFAVGPASVTLTATGFSAPVGKNLERNLLRLLHERASEKHP